MDYIGNIIRPPNEAESLLLQVTTSCSHNKCSFCGAYKDKNFTIKVRETILRDLEEVSLYYKHKKRLFLCDGDALIVPHEKLTDLLTLIKEKLPWIKQIGTYANAKSLKRKTPGELRELRTLGLRTLYMGLESGDDLTLEQMNKGVSAGTQIAMGRKAKEAGFRLSVTVLLGLGGRERSRIHGEATGKALSVIGPDHIGALTLMVIPGTPLAAVEERGDFTLPGPEEMLEELKIMIRHTNVKRSVFSANHASNYLPLQFILPRDKEKAIRMIDETLQAGHSLKPEWMRGL